MKLQQGQVWRLDQHFIRIVALERLAVDYKLQTDLTSRDGEHVRSTKKAFCRLIKNAVLLDTQAGSEGKNTIISTAVGTPYFDDAKAPLNILSTPKKPSSRKG
jgi:hypothetical protein